MNIGILSMQQVANYGSFLQAYGLKAILENLGHRVSFINIKPGEQLPDYRISRFHRPMLLMKRMMVKHPFKQLKATLTYHKRFDKEFKPELGVKDGFDDSHKDVIIVGSDEVFNFAQTTWFGFSPQLFGEGLNCDKLISYAGSFGATTLDKIASLGLTKRIEGLLANFSHMSIRDNNSKNVVSTITGKEPNLNIDPVLAYDFEKEIKLPESGSKYMIIYSYPGRMTDKNEIQAIKRYAHEKNLKIISVAHYFDWVDEVITPHPFEVLGYIHNAECVITDTFHGSVMSLKYNVPFATFVRGMNNNKLSFLLEQFKLTDRIVSNPAELKRVLDSPADFSYSNKILESEKENTVNYLKHSINE